MFILSLNIYQYPQYITNLYDGKTLAERIAEVGISTGVIYTLNKYVLQNDIYRNEVLLRMGIISISDVAATHIVEYLNNKPLEYLTKI